MNSVTYCNASIAFLNSPQVIELLEDSLRQAKLENKYFVIINLELVGIEQVSYRYDQEALDKVLRVIIKRLEDLVQKNDYVQQLGGNKYLVCLTVLKENLKIVETTTDKLVALISKPINIEKDLIEIRSRCGVSAYPLHGNKAGDLLHISEMKKCSVSKLEWRHHESLAIKPSIQAIIF